MSTVSGGLITDNVKNNLFDDVTGAQAASGGSEYRGIYLKNNHGTLTWQNAVVYISSDTLSSSTELDLAIAAEGVSTSMATIANEGTAPSGVSFTHPSSRATGLQLNSTTGLAAGAYRGVWVRRAVTAGATAINDQGTIKGEGDTAP